ncbi:hypothetical protein R1flu_021653 [Riccia fluitans]|uniref:Uncharacterized protein n=1 Tax=Riccia fluitans TaxID=41844 RepID=A0ABD1ZRL9_9MARC
MRAASTGRGRTAGDDDMKRQIKRRRRARMILTLSALLLCLFLIVGASASAANRFEVHQVWKQGLATRMGFRQPEDVVVGSGQKRAALYDRMAADLDANGGAFLNGGETSQSLKLSDLFKMEDGNVIPILNAAQSPVRAAVLHLNARYASQISKVVKKVLSPYFAEGPIWYQDESLYHFSLFHTSHHRESVLATEAEVEVEAAAVREVASRSCEMDIILDRVLLTSTGVLIACWQVLDGTDPALIRKELRNSLPNAPNIQLYDPVILHTSIARILGPPKLPSAEGSSEDSLTIMKSLVKQINVELLNFRAKVNELWFVEEFHILALALKGKFVAHKFLLQCLPPQSVSP